MRGRPRKPVERKILDGTFRQDRDGPAPAGPLGEPAKPPFLSPIAADLWDLVVPGLVAQGVAGERDTPALVSMCEWWSLYRVNMDRLYQTAGGQARKVPLAGKPARALQIGAAEASRQFQALAARFGLTPADRARLKTPEQPPAADPFEEFLHAGGSPN